MKRRAILAFLAVIMVLLLLLGELFPADGANVGKFYLRFPSLHSIVESRRQDEVVKAVDTIAVRKMQLKDSLDYYRGLVDSGNLRFWLPEPNYMDGFWQNVEQATKQNRTVRILHYGDSQIEMDHMTSRLRAYMQRTFGGGGPGMVPFQTTTPTFSVRQSTSGDLIHLASFGDSLAVRSRGDYGPMMQSFRLSNNEATVTIKGANSNRVDNRIKQFSRVRLIANNRDGLNVSFDDLKNKHDEQKWHTANDGISSVDFNLDTSTSAMRIRVSGSADLYCMLVDDNCGVAVDNIPMRGCSGQQFTLVNERLLAAAYRQMDIGLIILQFGGNSVPYMKTASSISTYCTSIGRQIDHIRACCPDAKILFIGPSDMSHKVHGELQTYEIIPQLIDSLIATATAHGAAYWSIYHAMGGWNTMPQWARQGLAGKDYIHFSQKGADLMGDNLAQAFENSRVLYQLEQRWEQQKPKPDTKKAKKEKRSKRKKRGGRR